MHFNVTLKFKAAWQGDKKWYILGSRELIKDIFRAETGRDANKVDKGQKEWSFRKTK